jgi:hypothetical protein
MPADGAMPALTPAEGAMPALMPAEGTMPALMPEAAALAAIAAFEGLVYLDFDETLYLTSSTEQYLDMARPALVAALVTLALDAAAPWDWPWGARGSRDGWRVRLCGPLVGRRWADYCRTSGPALFNAPLQDALRGKPVIVASNGFRPVIAPLLAAAGLDWPLLAYEPPDSRAAGKLGLIGAPALAGAMLVTDSEADGPALVCAAQPVLVRWAAARWVRAGAQVYLPGDYLRFYKRSWKSSPLRELVFEDVLFWWLLAASAGGLNLAGAIGIGLLFASNWSVYEAGYRENDVCALAREADPVVTSQARRFPTRHFEAKAWVAAALCGVPGLWLAGHVAPLRWAASLLALRAVYAVYNRLDKSSRVWVYPALQWFRTFALLALLPAAPVAVAAGVAQIIGRACWYGAYRASGAWATPRRLVQLCTFMLLAGALAAAGDGGRHAPIWDATVGLWFLVQARRELLSTLRAATWLPVIKTL